MLWLRPSSSVRAQHAEAEIPRVTPCFKHIEISNGDSAAVHSAYDGQLMILLCGIGAPQSIRRRELPASAVVSESRGRSGNIWYRFLGVVLKRRGAHSIPSSWHISRYQHGSVELVQGCRHEGSDEDAHVCRADAQLLAHSQTPVRSKITSGPLARLQVIELYQAQHIGTAQSPRLIHGFSPG